MHRLVSIALLISAPTIAQSTDNEAAELLRKVRSVAANTKNWRAEVVETSRLSGGGMDLQSEVRTKIAVQTPLRVRRQNSGGDRTLLICDGVQALYSGDGYSYSKFEARINPQCDFPLNKLYKLDDDQPASISVSGPDHVRLTDGDRECIVVRAEWKRDSGSVIRNMCIDPAAALILRDVATSEGRTGIKVVYEITLFDFEINPAFPPDTFRLSIPEGAVQAKPPI